jgi:ParB family transcriptional regulator, chromosome partitioning protein
MTKKNALGRGLGALIEEASTVEHEERSLRTESSVREVDINQIDINPFQPRKNFDDEALAELSESIKQLGIIQPITVRKMDTGRFQLISGERRFRASQLAGLRTLPAYIREANDQAMLELALVENIQREDLDSIEIAISYQRLIDECSLTQEALSERVGKKRATVANYLRLLKLPGEVQLGIRDKKLTMGHARALLGIDDPALMLELYNKILTEELSVRKTEDLIREANEAKEYQEIVADTEENEDAESNETSSNENDKEFVSSLKDLFSRNVKLKRSLNGSGKIVIPFKTDDELTKIMSIFDLLK